MRERKPWATHRGLARNRNLEHRNGWMRAFCLKPCEYALGEVRPPYASISDFDSYASPQFVVCWFALLRTGPDADVAPGSH